MTSTLWNTESGFPFPGINTTRFKLIFSKLPGLELFCNKIIMPSIRLGSANQEGRYLEHKHVGEKIYYSNFTTEMLIDSNMDNYQQIQDWMVALSVQGGNSETLSDATLLLDNSEIKFLDCFPVEISQVEFDSTATDIIFPSALVTFSCDRYFISR